MVAVADYRILYYIFNNNKKNISLLGIDDVMRPVQAHLGPRTVFSSFFAARTSVRQRTHREQCVLRTRGISDAVHTVLGQVANVTSYRCVGGGRRIVVGGRARWRPNGPPVGPTRQRSRRSADNITRNRTSVILLR